MKRFFGLFTIFLLALSPCASAISIPNAHNINAVNTNTNSNSYIYTLGNYNTTLKSTDDLDSMSFNETLNYLLKTNTKDQSEYILCINDTNASTVFDCSFKLSPKAPTNFHDITDNYKGLPLDSELYKGTLFYTSNDFSLKSKFITNCTADIDLYNWSIFQKSIKDTQYWTMIPLVDEPLQFPYTDQEIKNAQTPLDIFIMIDSIVSWTEYSNSELNTKLKYIADEFNRINVQQIKVGVARGDKSNKYWSPAHHSKYENVDDNGLELINMYSQDQKSPLDKVRFAFSSIFLHLDTIMNAMEVVAAAAPSDFGIDKPMKFAILAVKSVELLGKNLVNDFVESVYHRLDQETMDVSSEKSYRQLVRNGAIEPHPPTPQEIKDNNNLIDQSIKNLTNQAEIERLRISNPNYYNVLVDNANKDINVIKNQLRELQRHNTNGQYDQLISTLNKHLETLNELISDKDRIKEMWEDEKLLYAFYKSEVDEQINLLQTLKW